MGNYGTTLPPRCSSSFNFMRIRMDQKPFKKILIYISTTFSMLELNTKLWLQPITNEIDYFTFL